MTKQEVIKGLMVCGDDSYQCIGCPYLPERTGNTNCANHLCKDAIALLKEQENGIEPKRKTGFWIDHKVWIDYENNIRETVRCSLCNNLVEVKYTKKYCSSCGTKMKNGEEND